MGLDLSAFATDYTTWDELESVQLQSQTSIGNYYPQAASGQALRGQPKQTERATSQGVYVAYELPWWLPAAEWPAAPKEGDQIIDGTETVWTVFGPVSFDELDQIYELTTLNLVLSYGLYDTVNIQRAAITYDATGGVIRTWPPTAGTTPYASVPAKAQLLSQEEKEERALRGQQSTYLVYLGQQVTLTAEDRVVITLNAGGSLTLQVTGQKNPSRLDELCVLDCVLAV